MCGVVVIVISLQEEVGLYVVDGILEEIRLGMEVCFYIEGFRCKRTRCAASLGW